MRRLTRTVGPLVALLLVLAIVSGCDDTGTGPPTTLAGDTLSPQVGVNYNGQFDMIDFGDLERSHTTWVRGFIDFFLFHENPQRLDGDPKVVRYLQLKSHGYKTILNLKWDFRRRSFPAPGSPELTEYKDFLALMLDRLWRGTDIVVVGNEPFIESMSDERSTELVAFYAEIARFVNEYGNAPERTALPIYVGAFNNLHLQHLRTPGAHDLLAFARSEPWIAGIDLHIHHAGIEQISQGLDYVHSRIRADQRILVTEFSLMRHWKSKMGEPIPEPFAHAHGLDAGTRNYEYIDNALKNPVPRDEWVDFLSDSYWYENRKRYLRNAYQRFKSDDKFYIATYAMRQSFPFNRDFTLGTDPWVLNGIYANRTVEPDPVSGRNQFNYAWIDDFRAIQSGEFD